MTLSPVPSAATAAASPTPLPPPTVRPATSADDAFIEELQAIAFGPGRFSKTAYRIRERFPIDTSLSLVAEVDGTACGSVWMTPISIGGINGWLLGPPGPHPT